MKATKKIVGAACALVAAVALSAGSTFAWFSQSGKVTATGMKVQATVPTNLYIATGFQTDADQITLSTVTFGDTTATELKPAKLTESSGTITVEDADTFSVDPTPGSSGTASAYTTIGTIASNATTISTPITGYVYRQTMSIVNKAAADSMDTHDINVQVTVTGGTNTTSFLKCAFVVTVDTTVTYVDAGTGTGTTSFVFTKNDLITALTDNKIAQIAFVVWYDGDDPDCYADNAVSVEELTISLEFNTMDFS